MAIGAVFGTAWLVTVLAMMGRTAVYRSWVEIPPLLPILAQLAAVGAGVAAFKFLED